MPRIIAIPKDLLLDVTVRSREQTYYAGKAITLSSINLKGPFDILPRHTHFITLVKDHISIEKQDGSKKRIPCREGILKVRNDKVEIYIGTGKQQGIKK